MAILDKVLGGVLVGSYANSILYTLELVAVIQYYKRNYWQDSRLFHAMVYSTFVVDTVSTMAACACVYLYTITHWGDFNYLEKQHWPIAVSYVTCGISATIVRCFLIFRYWRLSQNNHITSVLILFVLAALGSCVGAVVSVLMHTAYAQRDKMVLCVLIWFSTNAATDVSIALALLWQLSQIKSPFKATQSLIRRLMASTIRTGTMTSVVAVITLILFLTNKEGNVSTGFAYCFARIYSLTMLYNLNNRNSLRHGSANANDAHRGNTMSIMTEIHVHRTATVLGSSATNHDALDLSDRLKRDSDSDSAQGKVSVLPLGV